MYVTKIKNKSIIRIYPEDETYNLESFKNKVSDISYNKKRDCYECNYDNNNYDKVILSLPYARYSNAFMQYLNKLEHKEIIDKYKKRLYLKDMVNIKLYDFQKIGVNFCMDKLLNTNYNSAILADEMGLGKSIGVLGCSLLLKKLKKVKNVLIVCPASAKKEWERMIKAFTNESYMILENSSCLGCRVFYTITNYDQVRVLGNRLDKQYYDLLVIDEFHNIKNRYAQRTKALIDFEPKYKMFLSGTPILNRVEELWTILNYISPNKFPSHPSFVKKYCIVKLIKVPIFRRGRFIYHKFIEKIVGAKNVINLRMHLKDYMIRRKKEDVLKELPSKIYQNMYVELKPKQKQIYDKLVKGLKTEIDGNKISVKNAMAKFIRLQQVCETLAVLGKEDVSSKLDLLEKLAEELIYDDHKLFIVAPFITVVECARDRLKKYNPAFVTGSITDEQMEKEKIRFLTKKSCKVYIGTIKKNKEAITLTAADYVIFIGKDMVDQINKQVEDRLHRVGQKNVVNVISIICKDTIEEKIETDILAPKRELFDLVIDGKQKQKVLSLDQIRKLL